MMISLPWLIGSCLMNLLILAGIDSLQQVPGRVFRRTSASHALSAVGTIALVASLRRLRDARLRQRRTSDYTGHMKTAAVARLKAELSRYLRLVKSGEEILVTEHRVPIARLVPIDPGDADENLRDLERQGLLRLGSGKLPKDFWKQRRARDAKGLLRKTLLREREAGW